MKLKVLDLFSGIGGFSLGLERTGGFETVAFCEIEPFPRKVLAKHWPEVPCYEDVTKLTGDILRRDGISVDVITGGFPCQDLSCAGKQAGMGEGTRSGLWSEIVRLIGELRPRYVIVENVAALLSGPSDRRGGWFGRVLGDLAECGYDAEWENIPASALGAPHRRERVWLCAYPSEIGPQRSNIATSRGQGCGPRLLAQPAGMGDRGVGGALADANRNDAQGQQPGRFDATGRQGPDAGQAGPFHAGDGGFWRVEPDVGRVVARISNGMDGGRLNAKSANTGTNEILRALRTDNGAQSLQWPSRGFGGIQQAEILFAQVCEYEGPPKPLGNVSLAGQEASQGPVRGLWFHGKTACASCRRSAEKQRSREHPNTLRVLSQLLACDCGSAWLDHAGTPSETSRSHRLAGLGNAVVPQIPELIGRAILEAAE